MTFFLEKFTKKKYKNLMYFMENLKKNNKIKPAKK